MVTLALRFTLARTNGIDRQPSSYSHGVSNSSRIWALIKTFLKFLVLGSSSMSEPSTINKRMGRPICGAANPMPLLSYMVSNMFSSRVDKPSYSGVMSSAFFLSTGMP